MRYVIFKDAKYINGVGQNCTEGEEISKEEYDKIQNLLKNAPVVPEGKTNKLTINLEWETVNLPYYPPTFEETTQQQLDDINLIIADIIGGVF